MFPRMANSLLTGMYTVGRDSSAVLSGVNNDIPYHILGCDKIEGNDVKRMTEEGTSTFIQRRTSPTSRRINV